MKFYTYFLYFCSVWVKVSKRNAHKNELRDCGFRGNWDNEISFLGAYMNFYPCFLYVLSDLSEISYKKSKFNVAKQMGVL